MLTIAVNGLIKMGLFQKNSIGSPLYDEVLKSSYKEVWILEKKISGNKPNLKITVESSFN